MVSRSWQVLFAAHFENANGVLNNTQIPFFGRYIDDCLGIVYASSETEAINLLSNLIQYEGCVIEWDASDLSQPFLDMLLFKDEANTLQWMPYRKARNHLERIPWISAHPYDVKRGTFLGEMSRLAVLSSQFGTYMTALKGLVNLYIKRGYPAQEVRRWLANTQERWNKRHTRREAEGANILVLKSEYNLAWNYFSARELGDTVLGYWKEWLIRASLREFNSEFPAPGPVEEDSSNVRYRLDENWEDSAGRLVGYPVLSRYQPNLLDARTLVAKSRTRNLMDLTNLWKRTVLERLEIQMLEEVTQPVITEGEGVPQLRLRDPSDVHLTVPMPPQAMEHEDEDRVMGIRESPPAPSQWAAGSATWGRGRM